MMYVWGHSFEFTCEADWEQMERFCDLVAGREDTWYATNIEIVDYLEDARRLQFTVAAGTFDSDNRPAVHLDRGGRRPDRNSRRRHGAAFMRGQTDFPRAKLV